MSSRTLPFLLALLLGLGALYVFVLDRDEPEPVGPMAVEPFLVDLDGVLPTIIIVKNLKEEQKRYAFNLKSIPWMMTSPNTDEATQGILKSFLDQISRMERRLFAISADVTPRMLEDSGLEKPRGMYILKTDDREIEVWVGDEGYALMDAAGGQPLQTLFVRMNGSIYLVPKGFDSLMEQNPEDLRNKMLFLSDGDAITMLRVQHLDEDGEKQEVLIRRRRNHRFYLEKPYETPVNLQAYAYWLAGLLRVRITEFLSLEKTLGGGNPEASVGPQMEQKPWMWIEIQDSSMHEKVELYKDPMGRVFAKKEGRPSLMVVDGRTFQTIASTSPQSLISTALWAWSPVQAWKVQVETASEFSETDEAQILVLQNRQPQPGFKLISPRVLLADAERYNGLFLALEKCRILGLAEGSDALEGRRLLAKPDAEIKLTPMPGKARPEFSVKIAKGKAGRYYGSTTESKLVFLLDCPEFATLGAAWWRYVLPLAFSYPPGRPILYIRLLRPGMDALVARSDAKGWLLDGKPSEDMDEVFDTLRKLVAKEVLGEFKKGDAAKQLAAAKEIGSFEFFWGPPEKEKGPAATLRLFEKSDGRLLARSGSDELLYLLRSPDARDLKKVLER